VNLQHDCASAGCPDTGTVAIVQERQVTSRTRPAVAHLDDENFVLNTSSLHNYEHIHALLPDRLRGSAYSLSADRALQIREQGSDQVRDQRQQKAEAQKALVMEKMMGASRASNGNELILTLADDGELLDAFTGVLGDHDSAPAGDADAAEASDDVSIPVLAEGSPMDVDNPHAPVQALPARAAALYVLATFC
jgi:hypothetical protein